MLMEDTVLLETTWLRMIENFTVLLNFCKKYGIFNNELQTQIMVVKGKKEDRLDFTIDEITMKPIHSKRNERCH